MSQLTIIADLFEDYRKKVIPQDASPIQIQECKRAFYAGAHGLFYSIINLMSDEEELTQEDELVMESVAKELDTFADSVLAERN